MQLFLKMLSGMANSVDPDQTAPSQTAPEGVLQSDLGLHCFNMLFCHLRTFTINTVEITFLGP